MDLTLKAMGVILLAYALSGVMSPENFLLLAIVGYLMLKHFNDIWAGAPVYT